MLVETEAARDQLQGTDVASMKAKAVLKLFSLLPTKSGYTTSYIPISSEFLKALMIDPGDRAEAMADKARGAVDRANAAAVNSAVAATKANAADAKAKSGDEKAKAAAAKAKVVADNAKTAADKAKAIADKAIAAADRARVAADIDEAGSRTTDEVCADAATDKGTAATATGTLWEKHFNLKLVETKQRRFGGSIVTDGCGVSVFMKNESTLTCRCGAPCCSEMRAALERGDQATRVVGVDPGFLDVVTVAEKGADACRSFSSGRYYEEAKIKLSARRTSAWNEETAEVAESVPSAKTADRHRHEMHTKAYLATLEPLLRHRHSGKGYRNMRFTRYVHKQRAVAKIVDTIAPKGKVSIVGFGDWNCGGGSPISRRTCGPVQEIKFKLKQRADVHLLSVDEFRTSKTCNGCFQELSNATAPEAVIHPNDGTLGVRRKRLHKTLHCRSSVGGKTSRCGNSWDRDANASRNLLMLTMCHVLGYERPPAFTRSWSNRSETNVAGSAAVFRVRGAPPSSGPV
jgi:hypothetical protein